MTVLPALLAGGAVALLVGLPGPAALRVHTLLAPPGRPALPPLPGPAGRRLLGLVGLPAALLLLGPGVTVLLAVGGAGALRWRRTRRGRDERDRERRAAVEACSALALELRAGRTPAESLAVAAELAHGPSRDALSAAAAAARWGGDVPAALTVDDGAVPDVLRALAACWQVCSRAGSGLAAAVERLADGMRARQVQERAVAAALAGPRASAALLALLPLGGVALAAGLGARPGHVLLHTPLGLVCLVAGLALDLTGLWWTGRLVSRASRAAT